MSFNKSELLELEELLVEIDKSNDKIDLLETLYFWCLKKYRTEGRKKLGDNFRDDL